MPSHADRRHDERARERLVGSVDKDRATPPIDIIKTAVQMMSAPGAPTFATKREKRMATVHLARQLWKSA
jgi:hypothetical protein